MQGLINRVLDHVSSDKGFNETLSWIRASVWPKEDDTNFSMVNHDAFSDKVMGNQNMYICIYIYIPTPGAKT